MMEDCGEAIKVLGGFYEEQSGAAFRMAIDGWWEIFLVKIS